MISNCLYLYTYLGVYSLKLIIIIIIIEGLVTSLGLWKALNCTKIKNVEEIERHVWLNWRLVLSIIIHAL